MWLYAVLSSKNPFVESNYPINVWASIQNSQNELLVLIALFSLSIKSKFNQKPILKWFAITATLASLVAIPFRYYFDNRWISGLIPNNGMNGILLAMLIPYLPNFKWIGLSVLSIALLKSSCAYLALGAVFGQLLYAVVPMKRVLLAFFVVAAVFGFFFVPDFYSDSGRFTGYKFFFSEFTWNEWLFGRGASSFFSIGAYDQYRLGYNYYGNGFFLYMHSDPLQFIYEYGVIGLLPLGATLWGILKSAAVLERASVLAFLVGGIFYYPSHFAPHLLVIFLVLKVLANANR